MNAWEYGSTVDENAWAIEAGKSHYAGGHIFITPTNCDNAVHSLSPYDSFDGISNDLPRNQGISHARCAHTYTVGHSNRPKGQGLAPTAVDSFHRHLSEFV